MTEPLPERSTELRELPPYRAVFAVDMKNFSGNAPAQYPGLTEQIPVIVERAFARIGALQTWMERRFPSGRGDGFVVGFRPAVLPLLVGPFLDGLQAELAEYHQPGQSRIRMRVSLTVGPLADSGEGRLSDGAGAAIVEAQRLLDSDPLRWLLDESNPEVTFVAAILSERVYQDVVEGRYTTRAPAEFRPVPILVKQFTGTAYVCAPKPSGGLLAGGLTAAEEKTVDISVEHEPPEAGHQNVISGTVRGPVTQARDIVQRGPGASLVIGGGEIGNNGKRKSKKRDR
jgi:hypothetical protein